VQKGESVLGESRELFQKTGRFGAGAGQGSVDGTEDRREGLGLMKPEQPAAHLAASRTHGQQVEELLILLGRPIRSEQAVQCGGIEVLVLHAFSPLGFLPSRNSIAEASDFEPVAGKKAGQR
jgi:hypothetical protein